MVQPKEFAKMRYQLQQQWGDEPCDHPKLIEEHDKGAGTGDYICGVCGRAIVFDENRKPKAN